MAPRTSAAPSFPPHSFLLLAPSSAPLFNQKVAAQSASGRVHPPRLPSLLHQRLLACRAELRRADDHRQDRQGYPLSCIPGTLYVLDPHSNFYDPKAYAQMREDQHGKYYGVPVRPSSLQPTANGKPRSSSSSSSKELPLIKPVSVQVTRSSPSMANLPKAWTRPPLRRCSKALAELTSL